MDFLHAVVPVAYCDFVMLDKYWEDSRDVSDPTSGPRTLTPGSVRGSLTSRLLVIGTTWICCLKSRAESARDLRRAIADNSGGGFG